MTKTARVVLCVIFLFATNGQLAATERRGVACDTQAAVVKLLKDALRMKSRARAFRAARGRCKVISFTATVISTVAVISVDGHRYVISRYEDTLGNVLFSFSRGFGA